RFSVSKPVCQVIWTPWSYLVALKDENATAVGASPIVMVPSFALDTTSAPVVSSRNRPGLLPNETKPIVVLCPGMEKGGLFLKLIFRRTPMPESVVDPVAVTRRTPATCTFGITVNPLLNVPAVSTGGSARTNLSGSQTILN